MKRKLIALIMCLVLCVGSASAATAKIFKLNANSNLRDPNDVSHVLTYLKKGTKVLWTGKSTHKTMYLVTTTSGYTGYIYNKLLDSYGAVSTKSLYKTTSSAKVYRKPSTSSSRVTTVSANRYVLVYATQNGWAYVKTTSGKGGYMKLSTLRKAS